MSEVRKELKESLSALMDGEASEFEKRQILSALSNPEREELLKVWNRYQISSSIIKGEPLPADVDYRNDVSGSVGGWSYFNSKPSYKRQWSLMRFGVAASVALITILSVQKYNGVSLDKSLNVPPAQHVQVNTKNEPSVRHPAGFKPSIDVQTVSAESPRVRAMEQGQIAEKKLQGKIISSYKATTKNSDEKRKMEQKEDLQTDDELDKDA